MHFELCAKEADRRKEGQNVIDYITVLSFAKSDRNQVTYKRIGIYPTYRFALLFLIMLNHWWEGQPLPSATLA